MSQSVFRAQPVGLTSLRKHQPSPRSSSGSLAKFDPCREGAVVSRLWRGPGLDVRGQGNTGAA